MPAEKIDGKPLTGPVIAINDHTYPAWTPSAMGMSLHPARLADRASEVAQWFFLVTAELCAGLDGA
jgi:hypothetical protein